MAARATTPKQLTFQERISALRNLPEFFRIIWQTSRKYTIYNLLLRVIKAAIPVSILYIGKLIIDQVIALAGNDPAGNVELLLGYVAAEFGLAVLSDVLNRGIALTDSLLGDLLANETSARLIWINSLFRPLLFMPQQEKQVLKIID